MWCIFCCIKRIHVPIIPPQGCKTHTHIQLYTDTTAHCHTIWTLMYYHDRRASETTVSPSGSSPGGSRETVSKSIRGAKPLTSERMAKPTKRPSALHTQLAGSVARSRCARRGSTSVDGVLARHRCCGPWPRYRMLSANGQRII